MKMRRLMRPFSASTSPFISLDIGVPPLFIVALMQKQRDHPRNCRVSIPRSTAAAPYRTVLHRGGSHLYDTGPARMPPGHPRGERPMTPHPATSVLRLAALIFLVASCFPVRVLAADAPAAPPAVTVSQPIQRELVERDEYTGQFAAKDYVE